MKLAVRRRGWGVALAVVLAAAGCSDGSGSLQIEVTPTTVAADAGRAEITVRAAGVPAESVELAASRGRVTGVTARGKTVTATLTGLMRADPMPVIVEAGYADTITWTTLRVIPGDVDTLQVERERPFVDADVGRTTLTVQAEDAAGNPVPAPVSATVSAGRLRGITPQGMGRYRVAVTDLRSTAANPVQIAVEAGDRVASTAVTVLAGAAAQFELEIAQEVIVATEPFAATVRSFDAWGNPRRIFGETAMLRAHRLSAPDTPIPVLPPSTNLLEDGEVTMLVSIQQPAPDVVLTVSSGDGDAGPIAASRPLDVRLPEPQCVRVAPTGLESRVQTASSLGRAGGFPLEVVVSTQSCQSIDEDGEQFRRRVAGIPPQVFVRLADGTLWGSSARAGSPERVGAVQFRPENLAYEVRVTGLTNVDWTPARVTATAADLVGDLELEITPAGWQALDIEAIPDQFGSPPPGFPAIGFGASLLAVDAFGNLVPTAQSQIRCEGDGNAELTPAETVPFTLGVINQNFQIEGNDEDAEIVCSEANGTRQAASNPLQVLSGLQPDPSFGFSIVLPGQDGTPIGDPQTVRAGEPFAVKLIARSTLGASIYTGNVFLSATNSIQQLFDLIGDFALGQADPDAVNNLTFLDLETLDTVASPLSARLAGTLFEGCVPGVFPGCRYEATQSVVLTRAGEAVLVANPPVPTTFPTLRANTTVFPSASSEFTVLPAAPERLRFVENFPDAVSAGESQSLVLEVVDRYGNRVADVDGAVRLRDATDSIWPKQASIVDGVVDTDVRFFHPRPSNIVNIEVADGPALAPAASAVFAVLPAP